MFGSMISRLNDTRISVKLFIAPVLITVFMLGMAGVAEYGSRQQSRALDPVLKVALAQGELGLAARREMRAGPPQLLPLVRLVADNNQAGEEAGKTESH